MSRKGIMLCYPFEEKRLLKWKPPFLVQPKLDGVRCRAVPDMSSLVYTGEYKLLSSEENEIISVPHINRALKELGAWPRELDGELYVHGMSFEDIFSITSREVNLHPNYSEVQYHLFDTVSSKAQIDRLLPLYNTHPIITVPIHAANNLEGVLKIYDNILEEGYEGIVVRHIDAPYIRKRSVYMMKFKPKKDDYYTIVGYKEEVSIHGEPKGRLGAITCAGSNGEIFTVGSGLTDELREKLWNGRLLLQGKLLHVAYQHLTSGRGVPRFPVFIEVIDVEPKEVGLKL